MTRDPAKRAAATQRWRKKHRARYLHGKAAARMKTEHGLTPDQFAELSRRQQGVCAICRQGNRGRRLVVDHDHATGQIRGLLCSNCNVAIGMFRDLSTLCLKAGMYLNRWRAAL